MGDYNRLTRAEKLRVSIRRVSEPPLVCPQCGTKTPVGQLAIHLRERCPGAPTPTAASRWVDFEALRKLGVDAPTADQWVTTGRLRCKGTGAARRYLLRDVDVLVSLAQAAPKTDGKTLRKANGKTQRKTLRKTGARDRAMRMANTPLPPHVAKRLRTVTEQWGFAASARRLDIPVDTLRRAVDGASLRRGTRALIEAEIAKVDDA